ncbi:hypothetical protein ACFLYK_01385 [Candidatus Cloacimonadota bacterium]
MKRIIILLVLLSVFLEFLSAQNYNENWGNGIITLPDLNEVSGDVYLPQNMQLFDVNGKKIGSIEKYGAIGTSGYYQVKAVINSKAIEYKDYNGMAKDFKEIGYEGIVLKYYEVMGDFLRVLIHTSNVKCYIKKSELRKTKFVQMSWMQFMIKRDDVFYALDSDINLQTGVGAAKENILTLRGDIFEIKLTGKTKGLWAEVVVEEYDSHICVGDHNLLNKYEGWIKFLNDSGYPNIWYYTRGC